MTAASVRTRHGRLRLAMAVDAARRWPPWRTAVREAAGAAASAQDGYGHGTFVLLNAVSSRIDEEALAAIAAAGHEHGLPVEDVEAAAVSGLRPLENEWPLRSSG
ncbi:hypothetical protein ACIRPU_41290 [Streptomyces sp. NPDC102259]|uniref:hypothetical protein n=1 Tax=Streptomyces sp. NPDC102259 TaxID=3366148 RepID=UPI0038242845